MSAFVCNNTHITALAAYAARNRILGYDFDDIRKIGEHLLAENIKSVNYRYGENEEETFEICPWAEWKHFSPIQIVKAADCLEYQSCEHPGWETSHAHSLVHAIRSQAICELPEWKSVAWEITQPPQDRATA